MAVLSGYEDTCAAVMNVIYMCDTLVNFVAKWLALMHYIWEAPV
jgi:hypothetical protein